MDLSIIIPAYNEEARINRTLDAYLPMETEMSVEYIVVVNGSNDRTAELVNSRPDLDLDHLRVVEIPEPVGKGGAILRGFSESRGRLIAFTDADGSTPPDQLMKLVKSLNDLNGSGLVIGSRWLPESIIGTPQPLSRRIASRCFNFIVRQAFSLNVTDTQCGAKVMTRDVMETVRPIIGCTQWAFDVDLLFHVRRAGFPIREVPIAWNDEDGSKIKIVRCSFEMLLAMLRLRMRFSRWRPLVDAWDRTLGRKLFDRRVERFKAIHRGSPDET